MVHNAFDQIEQSEPNEDRAYDELRRPVEVRLVGYAPEPNQTDQHENVGTGVKQTIEHRIQLQVFNCQMGIDSFYRKPPACGHVVPLEELMQDNAVKKTTNSQTEEDSGSSRKMPSWYRLVHRHREPFQGGGVKVEPIGQGLVPH